MEKVVLLGDSIRMGYAPFVREGLAGIAEVFFPDDNCRFTQYILVNLEQWVRRAGDPRTVSVVHWNSGHWDVAHYYGGPSLNSPALYARMLKRICRLLRRFCPQATLIFALTTPMNPSGEAGAHPRSNAEIERYNEVARVTMEEQGVDVNDLYTPALGRPVWYTDYCHFTEEGYRALAGKVCEAVRRALAGRVQGGACG